MSFTYTRGWLTSVPGYANSISYHANGMVNQVAHTNGVVYTQALDPNAMRRPASYSTTGATTNWTSGAYAYDGAGNVAAIGGNGYLYDPVSRLTSETQYTGTASGTGSIATQGAVYDVYGNITSLTTNGAGLTTTTSTATNRLTGATYDAAGSMTWWNGNTYAYEPLGMTRNIVASGVETVHIYTADDERAWTYQPGAPSRWTIRDLDGKVLRELKNDAGTWSAERAYVHRDGALLAAITPTETVHFHPDHLGTPRLITGTGGAYRSYHLYHPYGAEATAFNQDAERLKFTAHERDLGNLASAADDIDYMHARFYQPQVGRFLGVDPSARSYSLSAPQSWNRYSYVLGNPLNLIDPTGELWFNVNGSWTHSAGQGMKTVLVKGADGKMEMQVIQGVSSLATFDGNSLKLFQKDGTVRSFRAVSGRADRTLPDLQGEENVGPIPEGQYYFDPSEIQELGAVDQVVGTLGKLVGQKIGGWPGGSIAWGTHRVALTPAPGTNTRGRGGFFIHGGAFPGSAGCIDLCSRDADFFSAVDRTIDKIPVYVEYKGLMLPFDRSGGGW